MLSANLVAMKAAYAAAPDFAKLTMRRQAERCLTLSKHSVDRCDPTFGEAFFYPIEDANTPESVAYRNLVDQNGNEDDDEILWLTLLWIHVLSAEDPIRYSPIIAIFADIAINGFNHERKQHDTPIQERP